MNFICAAMSGVGAIVQAKRERERERERERLRPGRRQSSPAAGGGVKKSWAGLPAHCQETGGRRLLARSQEQETRCESEQGLAFIARSPGYNEPVFSQTRQGQQCHLCNREDDEV